MKRTQLTCRWSQTAKGNIKVYGCSANTQHKRDQVLKNHCRKKEKDRQQSFFKKEMHVLQPIDSIPLDTKTASGLKKLFVVLIIAFQELHEPHIQPIKI